MGAFTRATIRYLRKGRVALQAQQIALEVVEDHGLTQEPLPQPTDRHDVDPAHGLRGEAGVGVVGQHHERAHRTPSSRAISVA